jgi:hypothetical protein
MAQGILPFQYEIEKSPSGMTALAGLPAYLDLALVSGLTKSIRRHLLVLSAQSQGWTDVQIVMSLVLLNLAGGNCVNDLRVLEGDEGFARIMRRVEAESHGLSRKERRELERRWRKEQKRTVPSPSPVFRYLSLFHDPEQEEKREAGKAFIPDQNEYLKGLHLVNRDLVAFAQAKSPQMTATLDMDATLVETHKKDALYGYKGFKAYQPLNTYWFEHGMILHSEFRDGNVPAGHQQLRVFQESLACLPETVSKVYLRSDTAGYQWELMRYCAEGKDERFGVIEFAIGSDVTPEFKRAVAEVEASDWTPLYREFNKEQVKTGQEWAEVCFVPAGMGFSKKGPEYRYLAIREVLKEQTLPGIEQVQLSFPTMDFDKTRYKLFGVVTNRTVPGQELIDWHRERCGKSEEAHSIMKEDLAGGKLPSGSFGENAAWWIIMILSLNLNAIMRRLVLPKEWVGKRLKAIRFGFINIAGRVIKHAGQLFMRLSGGHPSANLLITTRQRILALAQAP